MTLSDENDQASPQLPDSKFDELRSEFRNLIKRARDKHKRARENANEDLSRAKQMYDERICGELLKVNLEKVERGQETISLSGYDSEGLEITKDIALETKLSPKRNMERYFNRARKGERGIKKAEQRLQHLDVELARLNELDAQLDAVPDDELEAFATSPHFKHLCGPKKKQAQKPAPGKASRYAHLARHLRPRLFRSGDDWEILVGRGAQGNDHLTVRLAHGNDYFFHIAGVPGGHVILRSKRNQTPSLETLLDCAQLALHFSSRKDAWSADIHYTQKKNVRKPKGAKPGLVLVHSHKTLSIKRDEERLNRLLKRGNYQ